MRLGGYSQFNNVIFGHQRQGKWFRNYKDNKLYSFTNEFNLNLHLWTLMFTQQGRFPVLSVPLPGLALFVWSSTALHGVRYGDKVWINRKRPARRPESHGIILPSLVIFPCTCIFYGTFPSFCHCNRQWRTITSVFALTLLSFLWKLVSNTE